MAFLWRKFHLITAACIYLGLIFCYEKIDCFYYYYSDFGKWEATDVHRTDIFIGLPQHFHTCLYIQSKQTLKVRNQMNEEEKQHEIIELTLKIHEKHE